MMKHVEIYPEYKKYSNDSLRMVNYADSLNYDSNVLKLFEFYTMIDRIVAYEYLLTKIDSTSYDFNLESMV